MTVDNCNTEGNLNEHQGTDECQPCFYFPSFRVGVSSLFGDDPPTHCGIFAGMVEALTSDEIILRHTHNARVVWIWTGGLL